MYASPRPCRRRVNGVTALQRVGLLLYQMMVWAKSKTTETKATKTTNIPPVVQRAQHHHTLPRGASFVERELLIIL